MRFVEALVDDLVMKAPMNEIDEAVREEQKDREL